MLQFRGAVINAALAQYERCRRELSNQLGVRPEAETEDLARPIRATRREGPAKPRGSPSPTPEPEHGRWPALSLPDKPSIAHEVNQPITAAVTNAHAALRWLGAQPPDLEEVRQALAQIIENGTRAGNVIGRIRSLIKKAPSPKGRFDLNEAVRDVIALTRSEMLRYGVSMQTQLATGLPAVDGDRIQLQQVVLNLILNAVEAMSGIDDGPRELQISTARDASGAVLVAVRDSGPGVDPKGVDRVFEAFFTTKPGGMGMGLAICRSIIEAHGGRLWASANEPRGAIFQFTFPPALDETVPAEHAGQMPVV